MADLNLPHLYLEPSLEVIPLEFCRHLWHRQTRVPGLSYGVVCVILGSAVLVELGQTDGHTITAYTALA